MRNTNRPTAVVKMEEANDNAARGSAPRWPTMEESIMTKIGEATSPPRAGKARARIWRSSSRPRSLSAGLVKGASALAPVASASALVLVASASAPVASAPPAASAP